MKLATVPLSDIEFGDRAREDYGDIEALATSISKRGLIQPLAVVEQEGEKPYRLLAGGRRFKALTSKGVTEVGVRIYPAEGLDRLEMRLIELSENAFRKNLEVKEHFRITKEIHELQIALHGQKESTASDAEGWSIAATADYIGMDRTSVSKDLQIANAMEAAPELFEDCKTKSDAAKVLKNLDRNLEQIEISKRAKAELKGTAKQRLLDSYVVGDFLELSKKLPSGSFDIIEVDPPFGISLEEMKKHRNASGQDSYNEIPETEYETFLHELLTQCYRVAADNAWLIFWFGHEPWFEPIYQAIIASGFKASRMVGAWIKPSGQTMQPDTNLANSIEMFFYARKGRPYIRKQGRKNSFEFPTIPAQNKVHPTERPIELIEELLATFGSEGQRLLVPCCGSGNTLLAGHKLGMNLLGYDLSKMYKDSYIVKVHKLP